MKYAIVLCDGMADYPVEELSGATPMECAKKPNMDRLAAKGEVGLVRTVEPGMKPSTLPAALSSSSPSYPVRMGESVFFWVKYSTQAPEALMTQAISWSAAVPC